MPQNSLQTSLIPDKPMKKSTISQLFCDTYIRETPSCCYILLPTLKVNRRFGENPSLILAPQGNASNIVEFDGEYAYRIRHRFRRDILARRNNPIGLYGALNLVFTEDAIKMLFKVPDIWLLNHNRRAQKSRATEINRLNYARKRQRGPESLALHNQCAARTNNTSVSRCMREMRYLAS